MKNITGSETGQDYPASFSKLLPSEEQLDKITPDENSEQDHPAPGCAENGAPTIPYFWKFHGHEGAGKEVTILGGVHGNETVGVEIIQRLIVLAQKHVKKGVLNLGIGNPKACAANQRFIEKDLNRCFGKNSGNSYEEKRAEEMKPILAKSDVMIDIHSTIKPSAPMTMIANKTHHDLAIPLVSQLGTKTLITGPGLWHPSGEAIETDSFVASHGGLGITVEAGWQEDQKVEEIMAGVIRALKFLGIFDEDTPEPTPPPTTPQPSENLEAYWYVLASDNFVFTREWKNFQKIPAGALFGFDNGKPLVTPVDSQILFPKSKENLVPGQQACILLKST